MSNPINKNIKHREFSLSSFAVDNATSIFLIAFMILLFGIKSYDTIPKEQFPEASLPTVYINTPYFGNSAEEIENLVTRPLENEIENITGIKYVKSTSIQDFSVIIAEFDADLEMENVVRKVKDAVDKAKSELPNDLDDDPTVLEVNFSEIPIVSVNVSGNYSNDDLREYAELLEDRIEDVKEVSKVDLKGSLEREIKINVDLNKMQSLKVSFGDIANAIGSENLTMSGGEIVTNQFRRALRIIGQYENVQEIENTIVKSEKQRPIYLKEIAEVEYGYKERTSYARADGLPVISLDVIKRRGQNLLSAADNIQAEIALTKALLPSDLKITLFNDQSINTRNEVNNLENSIISGVILVVLVLLFFLGLRNAAFVGIAIPLSMLMGIMFLSVTGATMNIVVLFSLILALGLLVDNGIVVVENIYRYMQNSYNNKDAAKFGAGEVAMPIIASTATTLAAFLPLAFWPGLMGEFMKYMPLTLIIVLTSSLFVALVINPVFTARFMKIDEIAETAEGKAKKRKNVLTGIAIMIIVGLLAHFANVAWVRNLLGIAAIVSFVNFFLLRPGAFRFQNNILPKLEDIYDNFIRFSLDKKKPVGIFLGTFFMMFFAIALLTIRSPKVIFFPAADPLYINAFVDLPLGKDIEATNKIVKTIETEIDRVLEGKRHIVDAVLTQIGENTSDPNSPPEPGVTPNKARITIAFVPANERGDLSSMDILNELRENIKAYPGVEIVVDKNADGPPAGKPINLEIRGDDIDSLIVLSERVKAFVNDKNIAGIEELKSDLKLDKPELLININRDAARKYELSTFSIADAIRTSVFGKEVSKFKEGEEEYPIMVRLKEDQRNNITELLNQKVTFRNPANGQIVQVPISAVADISYSTTYNAIKRKNSERLVTVFSNVLDGYNANEIVGTMKEELKSFDWPDNYTYEFTGEQQQQAEDMAFLSNAFLIAIFLIFIILVAQFNSITAPFIIILSVFFSTIGVFLGYSITKMDISVIFSGVGIISLAGIVVNNAIVLIDYIQLLIREKCVERGVEDMKQLSDHDVKEAVILAGGTRLRPVLLTAITTVLGLIPLAIGFNFNFFTLISDLDPQIFIGGDNTAIWGPMAWTIIYGLTFATFLTLIVVPVMFWLIFKIRRLIRVKFLGQPAVA